MSTSERLQDVEMQISEIEMLCSMFPEEIIIEDEKLLTELKDAVEENGNDPYEKIEFLYEHVESVNNCECNVEVYVTFPLNYPSKSFPEITFRSSQINRIQQQSLNEQMQNILSNQEPGELCMCNNLEWIKDNIKNYIELTPSQAQSKPTVEVKKLSGKYSRLWIYSHHIYSKTKRKNILEWSKELNLTGFSMPGKPGVVCVEGPEENCEEFWQSVKVLNWKHIEVRYKEHPEDFQRIFTDMTEISFEVHGNRSNHMNMGSFYEFLHKNKCGEVFKELFGVEGRLSEKS